MKSRKGQKKELDIMWAKIIKERAHNRCEKCGRSGRMESHHIFCRRSHSTRWDLDNGICLCTSCHKFGLDSAHRDPKFKDWVVEHIGEDKFDLLRLNYYETWDKDIDSVKTKLEIELAKY
jgi:hypothetical protein